MEHTSNKYSRGFLEQAHKGSSSHKEEILASELCACFYCEQSFSPIDIKEWIEEDSTNGQTAICPKCNIDSVLSLKYPITDKQFLTEMNNLWF